MKRRIGIASALLSLCAVPSLASADGEAKNIVFFLGDGMGPTTVTASRIYRYGEAGRLHMESLPRTARIKTFSNDAQTTDSAPSMAAYMTGVKMNNEVLSMTPSTIADRTKCDNPVGSDPAAPDSRPVPTILELAKAAGKAVGVVTTTELTHATPAATYAHICHRGLAYRIAAQAVPGGEGYNAALGDGINVMMGGARDHWTPVAEGGAAGRPDGRDLLGELAALPATPYRVVRDKSEFDAVNAADTTRLIGVFTAAGHMNYELDRKKQAPATEPSLSEMTLKAIAVLKNAASHGTGQGFFLMVEGGRIDHALHSTNAKRALEDTIAFDDAIQAALGAVDLKDTLVVVTADHDHTMAINGYPVRTGPTTTTNPGILGTARYADGTDRNDADALPYTILAFGNGFRRPNLRGADDLRVHMAHLDASTKQEIVLNTGGTVAGPFETAGSTDHDNYLQLVGVGLGDPGSETHGGGDVMLMADGAGSAAFKGTMDNTKVFSILRKAFGL